MQNLAVVILNIHPVADILNFEIFVTRVKDMDASVNKLFLSKIPDSDLLIESREIITWQTENNK